MAFPSIKLFKSKVIIELHNQVRMGYNPGDCLGKDQQGRLEPVSIEMRWVEVDFPNFEHVFPTLKCFLVLTLLMFLLPPGKVEQDLGAKSLDLLNLVAFCCIIIISIICSAADMNYMAVTFFLCTI